jgi:tetratricopeptide (TPR) repeat protein
MMSRLAIFCDKLLEAGWIAALIVVPLYFDIYSSRVFEPDKLSLLRSIALVMVGAWIIKQIEQKLRSSSSRNGNESNAPRRTLIDSVGAAVRGNPLLIPTWAIVVVYIISTAFSVTFSVSIWGSYQRMQGTYTTFSYIVIFLIASSTLRTRAQFDRVINTILITAFPIALYGILQHFQLDPLPWAGDTKLRVAANMGNSIFVAAYLIMVVPFALARWLETLDKWSTESGNSIKTRATYIGIAIVLLVLSLALWLVDFTLGAAYTILLFPLAYLLAPMLQVRSRTSLLLATYTNILSALLMTIFYSQSRGPWVGLFSGMFLFVLLYALIRGARTFVLGVIGLAVVGFAFLVVFNLPNTPLERLKTLPYIGRLGTIFDTNDPTGRVRELIWQGDVPLILPHSSLWAPTTGDDVFNAIRPLVGYGPESMYVVFNRFYPPDLAHYESRNASPDRSHNETFDSLVITGLFGFIAYILIFISFVYLALKWLGVITSAGERNAFIALWLGVGFVSALTFALLRGPNFVGVALPSGMIVGLFIFIVGIALRRFRAGETILDPSRALWLCALLAAIIGHFLEINFGIAIASTRLYFWFYAALLVIIGMNRLHESAPVPAVASQSRSNAAEAPRVPQRRRRSRRATETARRQNVDADESTSVLPWTIIVALVLVTLAFEFLTNQAGTTSALDALQKSLFTKDNIASYGVFLLFGLTWVAAGIIGLDLPRGKATLPLGLFTVLTFTVLLWYALLHLRALTQPGDSTEGLLTVVGLYYIAMFALIGALALATLFDESEMPVSDWARSPLSALVAPLLIVTVAVLVYTTNFSGVAADILYKVAQSYDNAGQWDRSITTYERALQMQPSQDFYALFLGRAYLESARTQTDPTKRDALLRSSEQVLLEARQINPLNTDHSANLARLQRTWATLVTDPTQQSVHLQQSIAYYLDTIRLSPNTAHLRDELAQTYLQDNLPAKALEQLQVSLKLDQQYAPTFVYLGNYYQGAGNDAQAADYYLDALALDPSSLMNPDNTLQDGPLAVLSQPDLLPRAVLSYTNVISETPNSTAAYMGLAGLYKHAGQLNLAQNTLEQAVNNSPGDYLTGLSLVNFLSENGKIDDAVVAMRHVVDLATQAHSADLQRFQDFYNQLQNLQRLIQTAQKSPNDVTAQRNLAAMWKARGQPQFALPVYINITHLAPTDYDAQKNVALLSLQENQLDTAQAAVVAAAPLAPQNEKAIWQNLQVAINAQKARQFDQANSAAKAALALASDADKPALQAYLSNLQALSGIK